MKKFITVFLALILIGSAAAQQNSMPGMDMPSKPDDSKKSPAKTDQSMPGLQMPGDAKPDSQSQGQAAPAKPTGTLMDAMQMEMRTVEKTPSHVEDLQEPEIPIRKPVLIFRFPIYSQMSKPIQPRSSTISCNLPSKIIPR